MEPTFRSWTEFFREERDVWVKAIVPGQVSLEIRTANGRVEGIPPIQYTGDPICLTDLIPFSEVRNSTELRKLCNPRKSPRGTKPPALKLMTPEEAQDHFMQKARKKKLFLKNADGSFATDENGEYIPDIEMARTPKMTASSVMSPLTIQDRTQTVEDMKNLSDDVPDARQSNEIKAVDPVHPRVTYLLVTLKNAESNSDKPLADDLIDEFEALGQLNEETLEYIRTNCEYKSVVTWASENLGG
jgi:hypothetical protein